MKNRIFIAVFAAVTAVVATGCAQPIREAHPDKTAYDADTVYSIDQRTDGFTASIVFSKHQFQPDMAALMTMCKNKITNVALDHADKQRRKTKPINEQRIKMDTNRNIMNGMSTCTASMPVEWK